MKPRVAMVTRWGVACGMDNYARELVAAVEDEVDISVHAGVDSAVVEPESEDAVWDWDPMDERPDELLASLDVEPPDLVHIQFNWHVMKLKALGEIVRFAKHRRIPVIVQLHATFENQYDDSLSTIATELRSADTVIVHGDADVRRLESIGVSENVFRWHLGEHAWPRFEKSQLRECLMLDSDHPVVATFGFLQRRKNTLELIKAMDLLRDFPNLTLLCSSALHPRGFDPTYYLECRSAIGRYGLSSRVKLITQYLPQSAAMVLLQAADVVVLPYVGQPEGTSAAAKFCAAAGRPLVVSREPLFDDYRKTALTLESADAQGIAEGIRTVLTNFEVQRRLTEAAAVHADRLSWATVGPEYVDMVHRLTA